MAIQTKWICDHCDGEIKEGQPMAILNINVTFVKGPKTNVAQTLAMPNREGRTDAGINRGVKASQKMYHADPDVGNCYEIITNRVTGIRTTIRPVARTGN